MRLLVKLLWGFTLGLDPKDYELSVFIQTNVHVPGDRVVKNSNARSAKATGSRDSIRAFGLWCLFCWELPPPPCRLCGRHVLHAHLFMGHLQSAERGERRAGCEWFDLYHFPVPRDKNWLLCAAQVRVLVAEDGLIRGTRWSKCIWAKFLDTAYKSVGGMECRKSAKILS